MGAIVFEEVGQGESTVVRRFQIEVVNSPEMEGWLGKIPAREWTHLHRKVTGSVNNSELYDKDVGFERRHVSWWRDPASGEIFSGVSSFDRI